MRQIQRAGEKLFVDFAGPTLGLSDGSRAHIFVAALGASGYTYALATQGQKTIHWIEGMTGALHFIGGVVELIVPDNPRAVIAQCDRFEPRATDSVLDFARHYGVSILPARPHTPQDKASPHVSRHSIGCTRRTVFSRELTLRSRFLVNGWPKERHRLRAHTVTPPRLGLRAFLVSMRWPSTQ